MRNTWEDFRGKARVYWIWYPCPHFPSKIVPQFGEYMGIRNTRPMWKPGFDWWSMAKISGTGQTIETVAAFAWVWAGQRGAWGARSGSDHPKDGIFIVIEAAKCRDNGGSQHFSETQTPRFPVLPVGGLEVILQEILFGLPWFTMLHRHWSFQTQILFLVSWVVSYTLFLLDCILCVLDFRIWW